MLDGPILLEVLSSEGESWHAELSFLGERHPLRLGVGRDGHLQTLPGSRFHLTLEGREVARLAEQVRAGEALALPVTVEPVLFRPRLPSVRDPRLWLPALQEVWVDEVERTAPTRFRARLRLNGVEGAYELMIHPGPVFQELEGPENLSFQSYLFDLQSLIVRVAAGERFALPIRLRPRWPTPPPHQALDRPAPG